MFHPVSLFIGLRYGRARQSGSFVSFITFFSVAGILLGVASLIVVVSVMNGFENELKTRILGVIPHVIIDENGPTKNSEDIVKLSANHAQVISASSYIETQAMIQTPGQLHGVLLQGVFPEQTTNDIVSTNMPIGKMTDLQPGEYHIVLGLALARKLSVSVGDKVRVVAPEGSVFTPMGRMPSQRNFTVSGLYQLGSAIDENVVLIHGADARRLLRMRSDSVTAVRLTLDDAFAAERISAELEQELPEQYTLANWTRSQGALFAAVNMEKSMMWLMLSLIVAVAAFNIVSALVMVVMDKQGEISILQTLGLKPSAVMKIFIVQGVYHGFIGSIVGTISGVLIAANLGSIMEILHINMLATYPGQGLPVVMNYSQITLIAVSALLMSFSATLYPAWRASKNVPAETLRYE